MKSFSDYASTCRGEWRAFIRSPMGRWTGLFLLIVLINFLTQIVLKWELAPGEFAMTNSCLGVVGLLVAPLFALQLAFSIYSDRETNRAGWLAELKSAWPVIFETAAVSWGGACLFFSLTLLLFLGLPRASQQFFILLAVFAALAAGVHLAFCRLQGRDGFWWRLVLIASLVRLMLSALFGWWAPWAESGLVAFALAAIIPGAAALKTREPVPQRTRLFLLAWDRDFLVFFGAMLSVVLALLIFSNADRIVSQYWLGTSIDNNKGFVNWRRFDGFQAAGIPARTYLLAVLPILFIFFRRRAVVPRTTPVSLTYFWIYLGSLVAGAILLALMALPLAWLFCGKDSDTVQYFMTAYGVIMLELGLVQALAIFSLASRRYIECFVFGGCSIGFFLVLAFFGRQPQLLISYMFGGALVTLMAVLCVGVVRYARQNP